MLDNLPLLSLLLFSPLVGILALLFVPKQNGNLIKWIAISSTFLPLILSIILLVQFNAHGEGMQFAENVRWLHIELSKYTPVLEGIEHFYYDFSYSLGVDGLSLPLVALTTFITAMAALSSVVIKKRWKTFYLMFLLLEIGMLGVFMARDLMLFFVFFELTLIPMFFLIGIWGNKERERAANQFLLYNGIGSALMFIAFMILISTAGFSFNEEKLSLFYSGSYDVIAANIANLDSFANAADILGGAFFLSDGLKAFTFVLLLVAFGIKLPIFPFHTWMLKVHTEAPPSVVMIHSGILLKMGAYGLFRFGVYMFPEQTQHWAMALAILGVINIVYGAILALVQKELKLVLAYSSISHMGIVLLGIASLNIYGLQGAAYQLISHGLISALMFLIVGMIQERTGTTELDRLGGMAKTLPFISGVFLIAGMASLGLPATSGFVAEFLAFLGLFDKYPVIAIVGTLGIVLTAVYVLRAVLKITFGPTEPAVEGLRDARYIESAPMVALVALILLLGIYPAVLTDMLNNALHLIMRGIGG